MWDPCTLLDDEYQGQAHHNTPTCRTSQDDPQHKRNPCVPDKRNAHGDSKTVLLYFEREDIFELDTSVLPRVSSDGVSLSDAIVGCLAWLKISCPSSIASHPEGTRPWRLSPDTHCALGDNRLARASRIPTTELLARPWLGCKYLLKPADTSADVYQPPNPRARGSD